MSQSVMKAKRVKLDELKEWDDSEWRKWQVERKIDGFRFTRIKGKWTSKQGKEFYNVDRIQKILDSHPRLKTYIIDGELAGKTWQQTMTLFRSSTTDVSDKMKDGKYWVFDLINPNKLYEPLRDRQERLIEMFSTIDDPQIRVTPSHGLLSFEQFDEKHQNHLALGCDGSILKSTVGPYEFKRSKHWLKVKPINEMDCLVVGTEEGRGKYVGTLGSLLVKIPIEDGKWSKHITGVSGMTDWQRHKFWKNRKQMIGKIVEVSYRTISDKDRLVEGRFRRLREDKEDVNE